MLVEFHIFFIKKKKKRVKYHHSLAYLRRDHITYFSYLNVNQHEPFQYDLPSFTCIIGKVSGDHSTLDKECLTMKFI